MLENNIWVEESLRDRDIALIGFADLSDIDYDTRLGFRYGICIAIALKKEIVANIVNGPSMEYYYEYRNVSKQLKEASIFLAEKIKERGFNAVSLVYQKQDEKFRTSLPFKTLATRSGLGWIGKSATLVTKTHGNAIRLNGVLTDMPLAHGQKNILTRSDKVCVCSPTCICIQLFLMGQIRQWDCAHLRKPKE